MKRYTLTYRDRLNNQHTVYIDISSGSGSATIDYGAESPLVIEEDNNDNMLEPIRTKTGYLKIVEQNFGDYDELFPTSPTSHVIHTGDGFWGYLQPQSFSNGWEPGPRLLKIPVSSPMNLMDNVEIGEFTFNTKLTILQMLCAALQELEYDKIVVPRGGGETENGFIFSYVSSLTICPFKEESDYQYPTTGSLYAPKSVRDVLDAICKRFGLILHDHSKGADMYDDSMLIITKNDYDGLYQLWTYDDLDQETPPASMAVTGATVRNFADYFQIAGDDNEDSFVQPYSKITYNNEGEQADDVSYHPEWSHYTGNELSRTPYTHCMLQPVGGWLISQKLSTTAISNAVALVGIYKPAEQNEKDAEEYILTSMPSSAAQDYEMFRVKMIGAPTRQYKVSGKLKEFTNGDYYPGGAFGIAVKYGNYYWDWSENEEGWLTNPPQKILYITQLSSDGTFVTPNFYEPEGIPGNSYEVVFYHDPAHDPYNYTKLFGEITLQTYSAKATRKYVIEEPNKPIVIEGDSGSMIDAEVDLLFSRNWNMNFMSLEGGVLNGNSAYLLYPQKIRKVKVVRTDIFDYTNYLCKWNFDDAYTWRLIAVSDDIANCERTLTFMGSTHI